MDQYYDDTFIHRERNIWNVRFRSDVQICNIEPFLLTFNAQVPVNLTNVTCEYIIGSQRVIRFSGRFMQQFYPSESDNVLQFPVHHYMSQPLPIEKLVFHPVDLMLRHVPEEVESITLRYLGREYMQFPHNLDERVTHTFHQLEEYEQSVAEPTVEWRVPADLCSWVLRILMPRGLIAAYREHSDLVPEPMPIKYWNDHPYLHLPDIDRPFGNFMTNDEFWHRRRHVDSLPVTLVLRFAEPITRLSLAVIMVNTYTITMGMFGMNFAVIEAFVGEGAVHPTPEPLYFWGFNGAWYHSPQTIRFGLPLSNNDCAAFMRCNICNGTFDREVLEQCLRMTPLCPRCHGRWTSPYVYQPTPKAIHTMDHVYASLGQPLTRA